MPLLIRKNCLREVRKARGLSGYDLQLLSHVPARDIYLIERGLKRPLRHEKGLIADALGMPEEKIFPLEMLKNQKIEEA